MTRFVFLCFAALVVGAIPAQSNAGTQATLLVEVKNLRNQNGSVRVALFATADGYPEENDKARYTRSRSAKVGGRIRLSGIRPGVYALALLHDENENGRLDKNFLGVPEEGIGASNDAADRLGPPRFEDAKFAIVDGPNELPVHVRYWL